MGCYKWSVFVPTYCINNKIVNKPDNPWIEDDKIKVKLGFKVKYLMVSALSPREFISAFNFKSFKEV